MEGGAQRFCDVIVGRAARDVGTGVLSRQLRDGEHRPHVPHAYAYAHGQHLVVALLVGRQQRAVIAHCQAAVGQQLVALPPGDLWRWAAWEEE